jgi:L-iditol 2-dehydrogenase
MCREPLARRRAAARELGAKDVFATVEDFVHGAGKGGRPLVIEATNSPFGFRDAVRASRIGGRVVLAGIPDGDGYTLSASEARRRGLKIAHRDGERAEQRRRCRRLIRVCRREL